jgi:hypothetical protein
MWMNPPNVPDVATATTHTASKIMKIVTSISFLFSPCLIAGLEQRRSGWSGRTDLRNGALAVLRDKILDESGELICSLVHTFHFLSEPPLKGNAPRPWRYGRGQVHGIAVDAGLGDTIHLNGGSTRMPSFSGARTKTGDSEPPQLRPQLMIRALFFSGAVRVPRWLVSKSSRIFQRALAPR